MTFVTLIPTRLNDGTVVTESQQSEILRELWTRFGGVTVEGIVTGHWIDSNDGKHYQDKSLKVTVACESERIAEAMDAVLSIGKRLDQKAMYFEVKSFGVAFLRVG